MPATQAEVNARYECLRRQLGVDRLGTGADAPPLPARATGTHRLQRPAALPIEAEMRGALMYEYGEIWARPGLDLRTRSFITVAVLAGLGHADQLYRHVNSALNLAITPEEIHEVLLHVSCYAGIPAWEEGIGVANEVFLARGIVRPGGSATIDPLPQMTHDERRAASFEVLGALNLGFVGRSSDAPRLQPLPGWPEFNPELSPLEEDFLMIAARYGFGEVWGRKRLPLRMRCFMTIGLLQARVQPIMLHAHVNNALNIGITPEEIQEAMAQAALYGGGSGWQIAIVVARHVLEQHEALRRDQARGRQDAAPIVSRAVGDARDAPAGL